MATENGDTGFQLKPRRWAAEPAANVPTVTLSAASVSNDATIAEAIVALLYAWDSGTGTCVKMAPSDFGGTGGGGAVTVADGADVAEGATADSAVITDTTGTVSGKLRGLVKWASERMPASLGQKTMASSLPVVLASDQGTLDTELPAAAALADGAANPTTPTVGSFISGWSGTAWNRIRTAAIGDGASSTGVLAAQMFVYNGTTYDRARGDTGGLIVKNKATTSALTNVASSATNVTLLASNANRIGASIFNESTQNVYVKFGATASATSYTVMMYPNTYYEVPFGYTGIIDGIWVSANGTARVTEITA